MLNGGGKFTHFNTNGNSKDTEGAESTAEENYKAYFERIYTAYFAPLVRFVSDYLRSTEEAENIMQDVFADVWAKRRRFEDGEHIRAFLFSAAKNRSINLLNHRIVATDVHNAILEAYVLEERLNVFALEEFDAAAESSDERYGRMFRAINTLPRRQREIFLAARIEGKTHNEIALLYNISQTTVNKHISNAMKRLKEILTHILWFFNL